MKILGSDLKDHKIMFVGAGSAADGVAHEVMNYLISKNKLPKEEALSHFYFVDSKGLLTKNRGDKLRSFQHQFARSDNGNKQFPDLLSSIEYVRPSILIGLTGVGGIFKKDAIQQMYKHVKKPVIFPLSNPTKNSECSFEDVSFFFFSQNFF